VGRSFLLSLYVVYTIVEHEGRSKLVRKTWFSTKTVTDPDLHLFTCENLSSLSLVE
jgi:hypothetical protein